MLYCNRKQLWAKGEIKMEIKGAIFDMDGTLVNSLMLWDVLWQRMGKKYLGDESFRPDPITEKAVFWKRSSFVRDAKQASRSERDLPRPQVLFPLEVIQPVWS